MMSRLSAYCIVVSMLVASRGIAQAWYDFAPVISVSDPQNVDCEHAREIDQSITYQYTGAVNGCCQWFYVKMCQDNTTGFFHLMSSQGGTFSAFYSEYYQPCAGTDDCGTLPVLPVLSMEVIDGVSYDAYSLDLTGNYSSGYIYISFSASGPACSNGTLYIRSMRSWLCNQSICEGCIPPFTPDLNTTYYVNAWAKEENASAETTTYGGPYLSLRNLGVSANILSSEEVLPSGPIIDGWQRMEGTFTMSPTATQFQIYFGTNAGPVLFDDIRIFPTDGSMKCYVYDPVNLRFVAELDERHFATFYEYDNEGKLVRVKKETERGIKTLKETRENAHHVP